MAMPQRDDPPTQGYGGQVRLRRSSDLTPRLNMPSCMMTKPSPSVSAKSCAS